MLFTGVPYLNHLGRSKFLKIVNTILQGFKREIYCNWEAVADIYPNQWPSMTEKLELFEPLLHDLKFDPTR